MTPKLPLLKPASKKPKKREKLFKMFLFSFLIIFIILSILAKIYPYFPFDIYITKKIQGINFSYFDLVMKFISFIGNPLPGFLLVLAISTFFYLKKRAVEAFMIIFSTFGAVTISMILKSLIQRPRPDPELIIQIGYFVNPDSFPSGHVMFYVGLFGFLLYLVFVLFPKRFFRKSLLSVLFLLLVLIGISRIYLGAHWFSDVIGAYIVSVLWLSIIINLYKKLK